MDFFLVFYKNKSSRQLFIRTNFNYESSLSDSTNQRAAVNEDKEREKKWFEWEVFDILPQKQLFTTLLAVLKERAKWAAIFLPGFELNYTLTFIEISYEKLWIVARTNQLDWLNS